MIDRLVLVLLLLPLALGQSVQKVHLGFPDTWNGDKYGPLYCPSKDTPKFLDGFFLCQLSASYGNSSAPPGQKLDHMIDAIGAIGSFHISNGQVLFSAQYYPSRPYKIWEFYDRNMSKTNVPWPGWSDYNLTAMSKWEQVPNNPDSARFHPNLDFWKVGKRILAGTEAPHWIGYEIDVTNLSNMKLFKFVEENDIFTTEHPSIIPISMAIHERSDANGTIWGSFSAMNFNERRFVQGVFTIDVLGVRRVVGMYDYGVWDPTACGTNDEYLGDKMHLPGYIHSITSTETYVIVPLTSLLINPCKFKEPPLTGGQDSIRKGGLWGMDFYDMVPVRFLIFDKKTLEFSSNKPLEVFPSMFITHQLNAYDTPEGKIIADMVVYDSHDPYVKYFYTSFLTSKLYPSNARIVRFTLDLQNRRVMYDYLIPQETIAAEFPQFNHNLEQKPHQWAYIVEHPFAAGNKILKINVDEPSGIRNQEFQAEPDLVLHEPYFVARPDARKEDDGVLLIRALDVHRNKANLLVIDAESMKELGRAFVPIPIPFGFHNRYYSKRDLGLPAGFSVGSAVSHFWPHENQVSNSLLPSRRLGTSFASRSRTSLSSAEATKIGETTVIGTAATTTPAQVITWGEKVSLATTTAKAINTRLPTPNNLRWWPLGRTTDPLWWQHVKRKHYTKAPPASTRKEAEAPYSETLQAFCEWLPKVFTSISSDACMQQGRRTVKWIEPLASDYIRLRLGRTNGLA